MADNAHEQAVLAAAKAWWELYQVIGPDLSYRMTLDEAKVLRTLWWAVVDWQQAEQARPHPLACQNPQCGHSRIAHGRYDRCSECLCRHFEVSAPEQAEQARKDSNEPMA